MYDEYHENKRVYKGVSILRTDPYGFWVVDGLSEVFTQPGLAKKAIDKMLEQKVPEKKRGK